jgi:sulfur-oxidizing protein SoxZ
MASTIRVRATSSGETTEVQALIQHPSVFVADWGAAVSKDPYVKFSFKGGKKGDDLKISWVDNKGATDTTTTKIQ